LVDDAFKHGAVFSLIAFQFIDFVCEGDGFDNWVSAFAFILLVQIWMKKMITTTEQTQALERLVYTSRATEVMGTLALFNLLNLARTKNTSMGVTGHLLYANGMFTQCIEGPSSSIENLWQSLQRDPRHAQISVIERGPVKARRFDEWAMAFSSYRYLNSFNMPGFFPLDEAGVSEKSGLCAGY
jgi:hypothetical protein